MVWGGEREWRDVRAESRFNRRSQRFGVGVKKRCRGTLRWHQHSQWQYNQIPHATISISLHQHDIPKPMPWEALKPSQKIILPHPTKPNQNLFNVSEFAQNEDYTLSKSGRWSDLVALKDMLIDPEGQEEEKVIMRKTIIVLDESEWRQCRYRSLLISVAKNRPAELITFPPPARIARRVDTAAHVNRAFYRYNKRKADMETEEAVREDDFRWRRMRDAGRGSRKHLENDQDRLRKESKRNPHGYYWRIKDRNKKSEYPKDRDILILSVTKPLRPADFPLHRQSWAHRSAPRAGYRHKTYIHRRQRSFKKYQPFARYHPKEYHRNHISSLIGEI